LTCKIKIYLFHIDFSTKAIRGTGYLKKSTKNSGVDDSGMAAQILRGEADICTTINELVTYRAQNFSFLQPTATSM